MKIQDLKPKMLVRDRWWPWKCGSVLKVLKTRVTIYWSDGKTTKYDKAHCQFLERA